MPRSNSFFPGPTSRSTARHRQRKPSLSPSPGENGRWGAGGKGGESHVGGTPEVPRTGRLKMIETCNVYIGPLIWRDRSLLVEGSGVSKTCLDQRPVIYWMSIICIASRSCMAHLPARHDLFVHPLHLVTARPAGNSHPNVVELIGATRAVCEEHPSYQMWKGEGRISRGLDHPPKPSWSGNLFSRFP